MISLNSKDLSIILASLEYTRHNYENYQGYPSYDFKQNKIGEVNETIAKVRALINELN